MKRYILVTLLSILSLTANSQDIVDYFYRIYYNNASGIIFRNARFGVSFTQGKMQEYEEVALDNSKGTLTSTYQVRDNDYSDWRTMSSTKHILSYSNDAVYSLSRTTRSGFGSSVCKDKITLLILPKPDGQPRKWKETDNGSKYNCSSEWAYVNGGNYWGRVIKIQKTHQEWGITETSYWAPYYGKIWVTQTSKEHETQTVKHRYQFSYFQEVTEKEYIEETAKLAFLEKHKGEVHSLKKDTPETYRALDDAYSNYLVNLYADHFIYYTGTEQSSSRLINYNKNWNSFSLKFRTSVEINDEGYKYKDNNITLITSFRSSYSNPDAYPYPKNDNWAETTLKELESARLYERPNAVEPISGYRLYFNLSDRFEQTLDVSSHVLKFKRKKNVFVLSDGDEVIWNACQSTLLPYLENQYSRDGKSKVSVRLIKFSSGSHSRFAIVTECTALDYSHLDCALTSIVVE